MPRHESFTHLPMTDTPKPPPPPADMPVAEVRRVIQALVQPLRETERIALDAAWGRVLADDILSPFDVPAFDNSAMDGYAFGGHRLTAQQPLELTVVGRALAGRPWAGQVSDGQCVQITTGAPMPVGADTVVPLELVERIDGDDRIRIPAQAVRAGDHCRCAGEELGAGRAALRQGQRLGPAALGLCASLGLTEVTVWRRPVVACLSSGDELLAPGEVPREGAIYDSNRFVLRALLARLGARVLDLGVVRDDPQALREALQRAAASGADAVITSAGVGMGEADHTRALLQSLGETAFWRVAMRPGRPLAVGRLHAPEGCANNESVPGPLFFGLPGNPVATLVSFLVFVRPALMRLMGAADCDTLLVPARSAQALRKRAGRTEYLRARVTRDSDGTLRAQCVGHPGSAALSAMVQANALIVLEQERTDVAQGELVEVMLLDEVV